MKAKKIEKKETEVVEEIINDINNVIIDINVKESIKYERLKNILIATIELISMKKLMDSGFIEDLKFVIEDYFSTFGNINREY